MEFQRTLQTSNNVVGKMNNCIAISFHMKLKVYIYSQIHICSNCQEDKIMCRGEMSIQNVLMWLVYKPRYVEVM